jgi:hypothetical protein
VTGILVPVSFIAFPAAPAIIYHVPGGTVKRPLMADFSYICKHLMGSAPTKGQESGTASCARGLQTGPFCTADSPTLAAEGKTMCPSADYLKILAIKKRRM